MSQFASLLYRRVKTAAFILRSSLKRRKAEAGATVLPISSKCGLEWAIELRRYLIIEGILIKIIKNISLNFWHASLSGNETNTNSILIVLLL